MAGPGGKAEDAAELLGSAAAIRAETLDAERPWEQVALARTLSTVEAALGPDVLEAAKARGRERSFKAAAAHLESGLLGT